MHRSNKINQEVMEVLDCQYRNRLYHVLKEENTDKVADFIKNLRKEHTRLRDENEKILTSRVVEVVYEDRHVEQPPLSHQGKNGLLEATMEPYKVFFKDILYDKIIQYGIVKGDNCESTKERVSAQVISSIMLPLSVTNFVVFSPIVVPIAAVVASSNYVAKGYLRRSFIYHGENPIYRIEIKTLDETTVNWVKPQKSFIEKNFKEDLTKKPKGTIRLDAKKKKVSNVIFGILIM